MWPNPASSPLLNRRRRYVKTRHLLVAASGVAALLAAGCSNGSGGTSPVSGTITIAATPGVDDAPLYLAEQRGLFSAAGLNVAIKSFGDGSAAAQVQAVEDGKAQIASSDYGNIFAEQASGGKGSLRLLADGYDAGAGAVEILVGPHSNISNPAQLLNKPIGVPGSLLIGTYGHTMIQPGNPTSLVAAAATESIANYLLSNAHVLKWRSLSQPQEISALQTGRLQAVLVTQPYIYQAQSTFGAVELMDVFSGQTANLPTTGYVSQASWATSDAAAVRDFQSAIGKAQAEATGVGPVQETLRKSAGMSLATADMVSLGTYPTVTNTKALQRVDLLLSNEGALQVGGSGDLVSSLMGPR